MQTIFLKNTGTGHKPLVLAEMRDDQSLIQRVKTVPQVLWNAHCRAWPVAYSEPQVEIRDGTFSGKAQVDRSGLRKAQRLPTARLVPLHSDGKEGQSLMIYRKKRKENDYGVYPPDMVGLASIYGAKKKLPTI